MILGRVVERGEKREFFHGRGTLKCFVRERFTLFWAIRDFGTYIEAYMSMGSGNDRKNGWPR